MWEYPIAVYAIVRAYNGLRFFFIKRRIKNEVPIVSDAEPFFERTGGKKVALLIHGFTSSPREFRDLSKALALEGISSYAPLLPGHGTSPERLSVIKHYQWIEFIEEQITLLSKEYSEIYIIGNSLGGNLGLICSEQTKKIKGVVTLATPIIFKRERLGKYLFFPLLKRIKLFQSKKYVSARAKRLMTQKTWSYQSIPMRSLNQVVKVVNRTKKILPSVTKPLLIMQVVNDHLVSSESSGFIVSRASSHTKRIVTIPESYHMFLIDKYAKKVHAEIIDFIKNRK